MVVTVCIERRSKPTAYTSSARTVTNGLHRAEHNEDGFLTAHSSFTPSCCIN